MKKGILSRVGFVTMIIAISMTIPTMAFSLSLTPIITSANEYKNLTQSDFMTWTGMIGPGGGRVSFGGDLIYAIAAASSTNDLAWWEFWEYGSTNSSINSWAWSTVYQLSGDPEQSADISLNYTYKNFSSNQVLGAGRTSSESSVGLFWAIVPAEDLDQLPPIYWPHGDPRGEALYWQIVPDEYHVGTSLEDNLGRFRYVAPLLPTQHHLAFSREYYGAALTWAEVEETGSIPLGSMEVGDYLFHLGSLEVITEAQVYAVLAGTGASMVSSYLSDLAINETPSNAVVPEPSTMLLLGSSLIGLAGYGRKKFFKK